MANENQSLDAAIVQQLEYYFGDCNLPRDKFLQEKIKLDDGWITIEILLTFNRLAKISTDQEAIAKAVKGADSEIISISQDGIKIRRNIRNPPPENSHEYIQKIKPMTVYIEGFPPDTTLDQIMEFAKKYGHIENILMRRTKPDCLFKGSVHITYKSREEAETAQKSEDKFGESDLTKIWQDDFWRYKHKVAKKKRAAEKKAKELAEKAIAKSQLQFVKGLVLAVEGVHEDATFVEIKQFFRQYGYCAYTCHEDGATNAVIRFTGDENEAKTAWDGAVAAGPEGKVVFMRRELTGRVLEGDEEEEFWLEFNAKRQERWELQYGKGSGRRKRGGGSRCDKLEAVPDGDAPQAMKTVYGKVLEGDEAKTLWKRGAGSGHGRRGGRRRSGKRGGYRGNRKRKAGTDGIIPQAKRIVFADDD